MLMRRQAAIVRDEVTAMRGLEWLAAILCTNGNHSVRSLRESCESQYRAV